MDKYKLRKERMKLDIVCHMRDFDEDVVGTSQNYMCLDSTLLL